MNYLTAARAAAQSAVDKKAIDVRILTVRSLTTIADYLVIATVESTPQMNAMLDAVESTLKDELGLSPLHRDGRHSRSWAVLDFGGLVVHALFPPARELFALEKMWAGARTTRVS